jgi:predicted phosphodiesterase
MRFAAASDIHGQLVSLNELIDRARDRQAELLVLAGDLTNAEYDGYATGSDQIEEISSIIESSGMRTLYVLGNRDMAGGRSIECRLPGNLSKGDVEIDGYVFTSKPGELGERSIMVNHHLDPRFRREPSDALLLLYGHDHVPRTYHNLVGLGYVRDGNGGVNDNHRGGFFMIDLEGGRVEIDYVDMGGMMVSPCSRHGNQGTFFVPASWGDQCPMCRNEEKHRFHLP